MILSQTIISNKFKKLYKFKYFQKESLNETSQKVIKTKNSNDFGCLKTPMIFFSLIKIIPFVINIYNMVHPLKIFGFIKNEIYEGKNYHHNSLIVHLLSFKLILCLY